MRRRKGFTLIEMIVALAILFILTDMGFLTFSFVNKLVHVKQNREAVLENISTVLDQVTKELRQTVTVDDNVGGPGNYGVQYPPSPAGSDSVGDIKTIADPDPPLNSNQYYSSFSTDPILRFYTMDDTGIKHRISYTLGVPNDGQGYAPPHYKGIPRQYWPDSSYEPCEILYSNETWNGSAWVGIKDQPLTDQVITNFTVIRPSWSSKVIQIVIEARVKDISGKTVTITRIAQITLRQ